METIVGIKFTEIHVDFEQNAREEYNPAHLKELADSIKKDGLSHPLTIRRATDKDETKKPYVLVAGYRRYKAMTEILKLDSCTCNLTEAQGAEAAIFSLNENLAREDISTYEKARGLVMVRDLYKVGPKEISKRLCGTDVESGKAGFKPQTIGNLMRVWDKLCDAIKTEWKAGHPQATTLALLRIIREDSEEEQIRVWNEDYLGIGADDGDDSDDDDGDDGDDGESAGAGKGKTSSRPNVHKIADGIKAIKDSNHNDNWKEGAIVALEWAAGLRKRLPGVTFEKKVKKASKKDE